MIKKFAFALLVILAASPATAGTIRFIDPDTIAVNSGERFAIIYGIDLGDRVRFSGPAGEIEVEGSAPTGDKVDVWVPTEVAMTPGQYTVTVLGGPTGDSGPASFQVIDPEPERLMVLGQDPIAMVATSREGAKVTYEVHTYGGRDPNPQVTCEPPSGSVFRLGTTHVRCVATNSYGERAEGGLSIFIYDVGIPIVTVPEDMVVRAEGPDGAVVTFEANATDTIDGDLHVTCNPTSGSRFPIGKTTVACSATDSSANTGTETFTVEVTSDEQKLVIDVPDPITAEAETANGAVVTFTVTAHGTSDPDPEITCNPSSGSNFPLGTTTVHCVAKDDFGNTAEDDFTVTVADTVSPAISSVTATPDVLAPPNNEFVTVTLEVEASDVVDPMPRCAVFDVTSNQTIDGDFKLVSDLSVELRAEVEDEERQYFIHARCSDSSRNESESSVTVRVPKDKPAETLVIVVPDAITAEAESGDGAVVTFTVTAHGTSDPNPEITCDPQSGSQFPLGTTTVHCVATDDFGNTAEDDFDVTVGDSLPPMISSLKATPDELSPPNSKFATVTVTVEASDVVDPMPRCAVFDVTSNQTLDDDFKFVSDLSLELRAERDEGEERQYFVHVRCTDFSGNASESSVTVRVPKGSDQATVTTPEAPTRKPKNFRRWW